MTTDHFTTYQLEALEQIIANEKWYEGERRGCPVAADDPQVIQNVCEVVLRIGGEMRARAEGAVIEDEAFFSAQTEIFPCDSGDIEQETQ